MFELDKGYSRSPSPYEEQFRLSISHSVSRSRSKDPGLDHYLEFVEGWLIILCFFDLNFVLAVVKFTHRVTHVLEFLASTLDTVLENLLSISSLICGALYRCIKHLNQSVLEGGYITMERSRRKRPRTPTPGHYLGVKNTRDSSSRDERGDDGRYRSGSGRDEYRRPPRRSIRRCASISIVLYFREGQENEVVIVCGECLKTHVLEAE
ncbi:Serine/arginine-rich splicing factor SR45a [Heracleum sosnowskyi]|uniref:Serine/arginine-rich splicing factor SR45a n=1 Tax=Heracleum sosnowskyi TaxID=360622 RepID=A0AAD8MSV7_9APIA|nr:Serine/arginine-rich splicing factor SR45a [Heracleum sosnowskyi]